MNKCVNIDDLNTINDNKIIGRPNKMVNSKIIFHGINNIVFFDENVKLYDCSIELLGDNSVIFFSNNRHITRVKLDIYNNSVFYLGKDANTTRPIHVIISERRNIIIGNDCLFSRDIWLRNADPHLIYDSKTMKRNNPTKSIWLGDHVWIGQNVLISKGTIIGSGSIIGGWSMTAGKIIPSNTAWGGSPIKLLRRNIFWRKPSVHSYKAKQTKESKIYQGTEFVYDKNFENLKINTLERELFACKNAVEKYEYLRANIYERVDHNRFFIAEKKYKFLRKIKRKLKKILRKFVKR